MSKRILTCFQPYENKGNLYVQNVEEAIRNNGYDIVSIKYLLRHPMMFWKCKIVNLNWFEDVFYIRQYYEKIVFCLFLRLFRKKIIYTIHNLQPHDAIKRKYSIKAMKFFCSISQVIVGLCPDTKIVLTNLSCKKNIYSKLKIVPLPNYIENYVGISNNVITRKDLEIENEDIVFLFFGRVMPYKNIELLIDIFKDDTSLPKNAILLIAGKPKSEDYAQELLVRIYNFSKIKCVFKEISDFELPSFYKLADISILPYKKVSSLNSGVVYLSFSFGKTVICPDIGTINGLSDKSFVYSYAYNSKTEREDLVNCIKKAVNDKQNMILEQKGQQAFDYVKKYHSKDIVGECYKEIYDSLVKGKVN